MVISVNIDKCTGCDRCKLACSYQLHRGFNPFFSNIEIEKEITGYPLKIYFRKSCRKAGCETPLCVDFCSEKAIHVVNQ